LFPPSESYLVAEPIIPRNQKTRFISPGQTDPKATIKTAADPDKEAPIFCWVGECLYWHTDLKQVNRHRDSAHCKQSPACGDFLEVNGGIIWPRRTPVTEQKL